MKENDHGAGLIHPTIPDVDGTLPRLCRVCDQPVTPWRRGWRRPTVTIHRECLRRSCIECKRWYVVKKERKGLFCSNMCQQVYTSGLSDGEVDVIARATLTAKGID